MNRWNASWDLFWNDLDFSKLLEFEGHCSRRRLVAYGNPRELTPGDYHVKMPSPGSVLVQGRAAKPRLAGRTWRSGVHPPTASAFAWRLGFCDSPSRGE